MLCCSSASSTTPRAPQYCYTQTPFSCIAYSINTSGALAIVFTQSSGGVMTINGIACSDSSNTTLVGPTFGNVKVQANSISPQFYPSGSAMGSGITLLPGAQILLYANCYDGNGGLAGEGIGGTFTGYVWIRYTFSGLPSTYNNIVRAASLSAKYT